MEKNNSMQLWRVMMTLDAICSFRNLANELVFRSAGGRCPLTLFLSSSRKVWRSSWSSLALVSECSAETRPSSSLSGFHCFSLALILSRMCSWSISNCFTACLLEPNGHKQHHKAQRSTPRCKESVPTAARSHRIQQMSQLEMKLPWMCDFQLITQDVPNQRLITEIITIWHNA